MVQIQPVIMRVLLLITVSTVVLVTLQLAPRAMARPEPLHQLACNKLPTEECAFAVDSLGRRCVLETLSGGLDWHVCQTSNIVVGSASPVEYIETLECAKACGASKMTVGLSSDALNSYEFTSNLCSSDCQENCANLVDLYTGLATGEGLSLGRICSSHQRRRMNLEVLAEGPVPAITSG